MAVVENRNIPCVSKLIGPPITNNIEIILRKIIPKSTSKNTFSGFFILSNQSGI
jgi:hypothetical protein